MSWLDQYASLGVTVFTPLCSFQTEISRAGVVDVIKEFEKRLDICKVGKKANQQRISNIIQDAVILTEKMANGRVKNYDDAVTDVMYSFIYAYIKQGGSIDLGVRGVVASLIDNDLYFSVATDDDEYKANTNRLKETLAETIGCDYEDFTPVSPSDKPTLH